MPKSVFNALLLTVSVLGCLALRWIWTGHHSFLFLVWNLVLAWVPLLFVSSLNTKSGIPYFPAWLRTGCWLAFFPNAPYLFTDLLHLRPRSEVPMWMDLILLVLAGWAGWQIGLISWKEVVLYWEKHLPRPLYHFTLVALPFVCAWGVYLGRFLRFNSWEIVSQPLSLFEELAFALQQPGILRSMAGFTLAFGLLLHLLLISQESQPLLQTKAKRV